MQYELNLRDYIRIFRKRKFSVIGTFVIVLAATFYNISQQPYVYKASTTIKFEERKTIAGLLTESIVYNPQDVMESETKLIKGFSVMKDVALRLGLITDKTPPPEVHEIVLGLQGSIETKKIENTNIIEISAKGGDARKVMDLVNAVAYVYIEQNLLEKSKQARVAKQFIADQLFQIEERLTKSEESLKSFGDKSNEIKLSESLKAKISELELQMTTLLQQYTEKHPKVIQLKQEIKDLRSQIKDTSIDEVEYQKSLRDVEADKKIYAMLKEKLEEARITEAQKISDISVVNPAVLPTSPIEPNKRTGMLIGIVLGLVTGISVAFLFETIDPSIGTIEDVENIIKLPVLGIVPSIHMELGTGKYSWFRSLFRVLRSSAVHLEENKQKQRYLRLFVHHKPNSLVAEAFRNIQANLKIHPKNNKVFLVTSSAPGEGKTTCVVNLGLTCAQSGLKTLLISSDLRRPAIAKAFGLKREIGLSEYLEGSLEYEAIIKTVSDMALGDMAFDEILKFPGIENISLVTSGALPSNPPAILISGRMQDFIDRAKREFDVIFFDSPPILPIADATILAPMVDSVVVVYEIGKIARQALMRAKIQIQSTGAKIMGVVLNNIKATSESILPYYYYRYKYTSEGEGGLGKKEIV